MKKYLFLLLSLIMSGCSSSVNVEDFHKYPERMNSWAARSNMEDLCDALFKYQDDAYILNRILIEFRRRNISTMNCPQYEEMMQEINKNKRNRV